MADFRMKFERDFGIDWGQHLFSSPGTGDRRVRGYYKEEEEEEEEEEEVEKLLLSTYRYRCPFSMLTEFDQWFEWQRRVHFDGKTTGEVAINMLWRDKARLMASKIEEDLAFRMSFGFGVKLTEPRRMLITNSGS